MRRRADNMEGLNGTLNLHYEKDGARKASNDTDGVGGEVSAQVNSIRNAILGKHRRLPQKEILEVRRKLRCKDSLWNPDVFRAYQKKVDDTFRLKKGKVTIQDILNILPFVPLGTALYYEDLALILTENLIHVSDPYLSLPLAQSIASRLQFAKKTLQDFEKMKPFHFSYDRGYLLVTLDL